MPNRPSVQHLRQQIENGLVPSESGTFFIAASYTAMIFTQAAIDGAVKELDLQPDEQIGLAETIHTRGIKIFAILIWMKVEDSIAVFRNNQILDERLPISEVEARRVAPEFGLTLARQEQWKFIPFKFPQNMHEYHRDIAQEFIMPFIGRFEELAHGAFGQILTVNISPAQQAFFPQDSANVQLVVKRLSKSRASLMAINQEQKCLRLLNQRRHPNIIRFLGSYSYKENHYFIFPRLDMDLRMFLQSEERFGDFRSDVTFFSALRGLASALLDTHNLRLNRKDHGVDFEGIGYHHDLRPANILVTKQTFVLADFGLGNVKSATSESQTNWIQTSGDYHAPECMDGSTFQSQDVGRAIDIWAMGCLMADIATYMCRGSLGMQQFSEERLVERMPGYRDTYFYDSTGKIKVAVTQWLRRLELPSDGENTLKIGPLIELALRIFNSDPLQRIKAGELLNEITRISLQAHFATVTKQFATVVGRLQSRDAADLDLRLLETRLHTWGYVSDIGVDPVRSPGQRPDWLDEIHDKAVGVMNHLQNTLSSVDQHGFDDLKGDQIGQHVAALWGTLPEHLSKRATDYWQHQVLQSSDMQRIEAIGNASSSSRFSAFHDSRALATMAQIRIAIDNPGNVSNYNASGSGKSWMIDGKEVTATDESRPWTVGKWGLDTPVLVEWMWFALGWNKVDVQQRGLVMELRAKTFGLDHKPSALRTLDCVGCFERTGHKLGYGFVYRLPPATHPEPTNLFQLLREGEEKAAAQPLLGDKFALAAAVADFLKQFHLVGWVHESFNSRNIIFFAASQNTPVRPRSYDLRAPYFIGLHRSRPDGSDWQTEGPESGGARDYHHPQYINSKRYLPEFDYYSLGVMLLEIGLWRSLESMLSGDKYKTMGAAEIRTEHIRRCESRLGAKMGAVYRDVALRCLDGTLETVTSQQASDGGNRIALRTGLFGEFIESVVEPLERLAAASI